MTTFDRLMQDSKFKAEFEKGYTEFLISEFMIEKMEEENISVRELAKEVNVSPTTIQNLRSGNAETVKFKTLSSIMQRLGYVLQPVKMPIL
ncbi:helix-turn-helix domain-containing protein [Treponema putidum]|uniref:XRE family transcriptional regulator n=1 Tax=Treponema putidum TaxID=221027 RepID=A0AAE9MT79_9SPIR|nr:helix-turn-helix transcriptional regulator [Treponema putidum]UTY33275.1 XRE family transcriptional regulator [Treponema putidum]